MSEREIRRIQIVEADFGKGRKKIAQAQKWQKNLEQRERYKAKKLPNQPKCKHEKRYVYKYSEVSMTNIRRFHELFYKEPDRKYQNDLILKYVQIHSTSTNTVKQQLTNYFIPIKKEQQTTLKRVCRKFFIEILGIKKDRLHRLCKQFLTSGNSLQESRGGDHKKAKYEQKRLSVKQFIEGLSSVESHYVRSKNVTRYYLSCDLSISKLHKMYSSTVSDANLDVTYNYFYNIFVKQFNISTGSPATDVCSTCLSLNEEINRANETEKKVSLITKFNLHKSKAATFYRMLKYENDEILILSFDCQKNLSLPKVPDQSVYYSRQMYLYNLTVCVGPSTSQMTTDNTFSYVWLEHEFPKSSNEISSAVFDMLNKIDLQGKKLIRLFADGCGGQNKNSIVITMLLHWLAMINDPPQIEVVFSIVGHSFLPPDRIFGIVERRIRKMETIITPEEYIDVIKQNSTVRRLGTDCCVFDFRSMAQNITKKPGNWHIQFQKCKRFILEEITKNGIPLHTVRGEIHYKTNAGKGLSVLKKKKSLYSSPELINKGVSIKQEKLKDVESLLLKHFGESWKNDSSLKFYVDLLNIQNHSDLNDQVLNDDLEDVGIIPEEEDEDNNNNIIMMSTSIENQELDGPSVEDNDKVILNAERDKNRFLENIDSECVYRYNNLTENDILDAEVIIIDEKKTV